MPAAVGNYSPIEAESKRSIWHKIFASYPDDGELQPQEGFAYSFCGFGQNLVFTIIASYLTI